jgi:rhodanese-related sulfurtransferase
MEMKKLVMQLAISLTLAAVLAGCGGGAATETTAIGDIITTEASTLIQENSANPDFVILDVRTPGEFGDGHLENAVNLDYYAETFRDDIDKLDKSKTYLVYCRSGKRSRAAADIMQELGFGSGYNMLGGIIQWRSDGLPTVK